MHSGNATSKRLSRAMTGQGEGREVGNARKNRENIERNLNAAENKRRSNEAARLADKFGEKAGIPKTMRDAYTKPLRK